MSVLQTREEGVFLRRFVHFQNRNELRKRGRRYSGKTKNTGANYSYNVADAIEGDDNWNESSFAETLLKNRIESSEIQEERKILTVIIKQKSGATIWQHLTLSTNNLLKTNLTV